MWDSKFGADYRPDENLLPNETHWTVKVIAGCLAGLVIVGLLIVLF